MIHLIDYIGEPALYEHLAEECTELAKASLKYARLLRGENPMGPHTNFKLLEYDLAEEATDVLILLEEVGLEKPDGIIYTEKIKRTMCRIVDAGLTKDKG